MNDEPDITVYTGPEYQKPGYFMVGFCGFRTQQQCDDFLKLLQHHGIAKKDITKIGTNIH